MRDGGQPWDVGGIFDINIRPLAPIETMYAAMLEAGFNGYAPITAYNFSGLEVQEVVARGHDGVAIALIQRDNPPLEGFEGVSGPASYVFNSTQTVRSVAEAKTFYEGALGWRPVFESEWVHPGAGDNCIGLPLDIARKHPLKAGIWHPHGLNEGSVECLEIEGVEGRDYAATCQPPNRGIAALRFPVSDLDGVMAAGVSGGAHVVAPPRAIEIAPYGRFRMGAIATPWHARLEFYEVATG
jgi:predicted enzyme related to lactoylglutathione lyase